MMNAMDTVDETRPSEMKQGAPNSRFSVDETAATSTIDRLLIQIGRKKRITDDRS